jgi:hypothetical protein
MLGIELLSNNKIGRWSLSHMKKGLLSWLRNVWQTTLTNDVNMVFSLHTLSDMGNKTKKVINGGGYYGTIL